MELPLHLYAHLSHRIQNGRQGLRGVALVLAGIAALARGHDLSVERRQREVAHDIAGLTFYIGQLRRKTRLAPHKGNIQPLGGPTGKGALRRPQHMGLPCLPLIALIAL